MKASCNFSIGVCLIVFCRMRTCSAMVSNNFKERTFNPRAQSVTRGVSRIDTRFSATTRARLSCTGDAQRLKSSIDTWFGPVLTTICGPSGDRFPANCSRKISRRPSPVTPRKKSSVSVTATFTDAEAGDTHTATINWGDGTGDQTGTVTYTPGTSPGQPSTGNVKGGHIYTAAGNYTVTVRVTDDNSGVGIMSFAVAVANEAPTAVLGNGGAVNEGSAGSVAATLTCRLTGREPSAFMATTIQSPLRTAQVSAWVPGPAAWTARQDGSSILADLQNELALVHSITSSARASTESGT